MMVKKLALLLLLHLVLVLLQLDRLQMGLSFTDISDKCFGIYHFYFFYYPSFFSLFPVRDS